MDLNETIDVTPVTPEKANIFGICLALILSIAFFTIVIVILEKINSLSIFANIAISIAIYVIAIVIIGGISMYKMKD